MTKVVQAVVGSIVVVDVLIFCALIHSVFDLKAAQKKMQCSLIWELILYKFKLALNTMEVIKNVCRVKSWWCSWSQ